MEIGAGNLALSVELLHKFDRGLAVDFTDDLAESFAGLPQELRGRLDILQANIMDDAIPGDFDCVVTCEVMEHIEDDRAFLMKIRNSLKPGGQAVISVPAKAAFWTIHDELVGHLRRYERAELIEMAANCGFIDVRVVSYGYPWINWLSHLRVWLARRSMTDRRDWAQERQTRMSNHRQIPAWLSSSIVPIFFNRFTIYPFALFSRLFNQVDWSDGYILSMNRSAAGVERD